MDINEIFYSIQGEGSLSGLPTIFIRTAGCNLRCSYCDSTYAYEKNISMSIEDILENIEQYHCAEICITGGEPLLQKEIEDLINALQEKRYHISIETNGSQDISKIKEKTNILISLDVKCPSSEMQSQNNLSNISLLEKTDQLKFIIWTNEDYEYAKKIIKTHQPICMVFFQPVWNTDPAKLARWILKDNLSVHLGLQIHKILWGDKKGV